MMLDTIAAAPPWYNVGMSDTTWITTAEAAELSGYTRQHIAYLLQKGRIDGRKFGVLWQVDRESLLAYVAEQEAKGDKRGPKSD